MAGPHHSQLDLRAAPVRIGHWMTARPYRKDPKRKTQRWALYGDKDCYLGEIRWHAPWRRYCVAFSGNLAGIYETVVDADCLDALSTHLKVITAARQRARRIEKIYEDIEKQNAKK